MRFLLKATIPVEAGNDLVRDPKFGERLQGILAQVKPEAAYFLAEHGQRTMYLVVNFDDPAELPAYVEPFWLSLEAEVEVLPVMNQEDFARAATHIQAAAQRY
ncbi:MAG TPA: DUF3303 family protein [bacterium]|nr:DUF3303 family protein [bacterium]